MSITRRQIFENLTLLATIEIDGQTGLKQGDLIDRLSRKEK